MNKSLAALSKNIAELIDAYLESGDISRAELIGMLEMLKLGYFHEFIFEDAEDDAEGFDE